MSTRGRVKWFDPKKGYGFIVGPEGQDVFVHYSHIDADGFRLLKDGEWVDYELLQGDKGWQARSVQRLEVHVNREATEDPVAVKRSSFDGEQDDQA
jgi:CspA family cold shock protein